MKKLKITALPPIAVEERPEKLSLSLPSELKASMEQFGEFFAQVSGQTPTSFNAVVVGILTGYMEGHGGYQKWLKTKARGAGLGHRRGNADSAARMPKKGGPAIAGPPWKNQNALLLSRSCAGRC